MKQEAFQMHRYHATRFVSRNYESDLQAHSRSLAFVGEKERKFISQCKYK